MPQVVLFAVMAWIGEARSFTHQQRLSLQVASVLTGQNESSTLSTAPTAPKPSPSPVIPTDIFAKKLDLALEQTTETRLLALSLEPRVTEDVLIPKSLRAVPPHEPPRAVVQLT